MRGVERMQEVGSLEELREMLGDCARCPLHQSRTKLVFGHGDPGADLMFVGEAPGRAEDARGLPFVGPAGRLLDEMLGSIGMERRQVYITNVVKCRPPGNRDPLPLEVEACNPFLTAQIRLIKPRIVCELGRIAAGVMMGRPVPITRNHGRSFTGPGYSNVPVFHPAAALRAPATMELLRQDFQNLLGYLEEEPAPAAAPGGPGKPEEPVEPEQMGLF